MKRALRGLISLYPSAWRGRYRAEFEALLEDVPPTWKTLFDVLSGAVKMQWKTWSAWKIVAAFAVAGVLAGVGYSLTIRNQYVSTAIIRASPDASDDKLNMAAQAVLSRFSLATMINAEGLYKGERARMPLDDVIEQMRHDIMIKPVRSADGRVLAFSVSVTASDAAGAQRATRTLADRFVEEKTGSILYPACLPVHPTSSQMMLFGFVIGLLAGALFALFRGLKVWKLAAVLGIAGAVLGTVVAFAIPDRPLAAGTGLFIGLGCAVLLGLWRMFVKRPGLTQA